MKFLDIRTARKRAGKSQDDLAQLLGVNRATISKYETGAIEPSVSQLMKIADYLQTDLENLFDLNASFFQRGFQAGYESGIKVKSQEDSIEARAIRAVWADDGYSFSEMELALIGAFSKLNDEGQRKAVERIEELTEIPKYKKAPDATNIQD